ncbi:MAG: ABC transporter ATP-binding protein/permease [Ruminococcus sp.]|nr:ABC transporter ATP-binding protein/permease [Ruminococcus sp.]
MIRIYKNIKGRDWIFVAICVVFIVCQVQLNLKLPDYMSEITTLVQTEGSEMSDVLSAGGKMLLCALGSFASSVIVGFFASRIAAGFSMNVRDKVYTKVMSFSDEQMNKFSIASLITRSTNDITQLQMFTAMGLEVLISAPITAVLAIIKISNKSWQWTLLTGCVVAFIVIILVFVMVFAIPRFRKIQGLTDRINLVTRENLTGLLVVRAYNAEEYQENKFDEANQNLTKTQLQANLAMSVMSPGMNLAMNGLSLGIYWIGATLISNVALTSAAAVAERIGIFSDMVVFVSYAMQVVMAFMMLIMIFIMLPRVAVSARRINEVLDTDLTIKDGKASDDNKNMVGEIEFKNVSFRYTGESGDVIKNITFSAHKGETVALIGATGSGKSTIISLIPRTYDATGGEVLVDGINVKDYTQKALRKKIGYVPQKAFLFSGTVEENIGYGEDEIDKDNIKKAIEIAQAKEFVETEDVGYNGYVSQSGSNFSGGQKQRLSIARAIAKNPEILIFDDSFSALDYKTDRTLRTALKNETNDITTIIVAQRIGTIKDADRILVIDEGEIVGNGTHDELMRNCDVYKQIAYSQLSKEELGI